MNNNVLDELTKPFHPSRITWKPGALTGKKDKALALAYADLRSYQARLDEVCGIDWSVSYTPWGDRIICHLTVMGVTRSSTGEPDSDSDRNSNNGSVAEAMAFKRACAMFGLGRYLYNLPVLWVEYDAPNQRFTDKARARLHGVIAQHYKRYLDGQSCDLVADDASDDDAGLAVSESPNDPVKPTGDSGGFGRETSELNVLGKELYGDQWTSVLAHNVKRLTGAESVTLTEAQEHTLLNGLRKLKQQRKAIRV